MALFEDIVDLMDWTLSESWRPTNAYRAPALGTSLLFGTGLPTREPHRVAGNVSECIDNGVETTDKWSGIDHAVIDSVLLHRSGRGNSGSSLEE